VFAVNGTAQPVEWAVPPADYSDIQCIAKHTFKAVRGDQLTILSTCDSHQIEPKFVCDEVTRFYKNWALLIKHVGERRQVIGCLSSDGTCNVFDKSFYTLANQEFYSEDFLTVENSKGEKVYIDHQGNEMIGLGKKYYRIKPFSEGFAVAFHNEKESHYINTEGQRHQIRSPLFNNVKLTLVTNFYQGKALMVGKNKDYFICDVNGKGEKLPQKPKDIEDDYLYRFINNGTVQKTIPYDPDYSGEKNQIVKLKIEGKGKETRYGYVTGDGNETVLPCQFALAEPFTDGFAVVKTADGKYGILKLLSGDATEFSIKPVLNTIQYDKPLDKVICQFKVSPAKWNGNQLQAEVVTPKVGEVKSQEDGLFSFAYYPAGKHSKETFNINVLSEGLLLETTSVNIEFKQKEPPKCSTCGLELGRCKDNGKHIHCKKKKCGRIIDHNGIVKGRCPVNGNHPKPKDECPDCHLPISQCKFHGNHGIH